MTVVICPFGDQIIGIGS